MRCTIEIEGDAMINLEKEDISDWEKEYRESEFKEHILRLFDIELESSTKHAADYVKDNREYIAVLSALTLTHFLFTDCSIAYRMLLNSILLILGFITLYEIDKLEFKCKDKKLTKIYEDYLVTNNWELVMDRPNTLLTNKDLKIDCSYTLYIDETFGFVLTKKQFEELSILRNIDDCPLILDLREAIEFANRFKDGEARYDNSEVYEYYKSPFLR